MLLKLKVKHKSHEWTEPMASGWRSVFRPDTGAVCHWVLPEVSLLPLGFLGFSMGGGIHPSASVELIIVSQRTNTCILVSLSVYTLSFLSVLIPNHGLMIVHILMSTWLVFSSDIRQSSKNWFFCNNFIINHRISFKPKPHCTFFRFASDGMHHNVIRATPPG